MTGRWEGFGRDALHLFVLTNFALAQPLYSVLGQGVEFFVARRTEPAEVLLLVLALGLGPAALGVLLEAAAALLGRSVRAVVHALLAAVCVTAIVLQVVRDVEVLPGDMLILDAALLAVVVAALYSRWRPLRMMVSVLAPAPVVFAVLFLGFTPVAQIVFPSEADRTASPVVQRPRPIVLVVFDEFNSTLLMDAQRRIDPARYPNLAAFAADGIWFRNATTVSDSTVEAVPAILTGRRPVWPVRRLPALTDYPDNLFTLLSRSYAMVAFESVTRLCPDLLCTRAPVETGPREALVGLVSDLWVVYQHVVLPVDMRAALPSTAHAWTGFATEAERDPAGVFGQFVSSIGRTEQPVLYFLHTLLPHVPWRYLPSGHVYESRLEGMSMEGWELVGQDRWGRDEWAVTQGLQRHLLQLGLVDRLVGHLVRRLKEAGFYDEAVIILTADHGLTFRPGEPRRDLSVENAGDVAAVPLLVKIPGQRPGQVRDDNVETIDILPTIADVLGVGIPWPVDGRSLLGPPRPADERKWVVPAKTRELLGLDPGLPARWETLDRLLALFGSGAEPDRLYRLGPYGALVGRAVEVVEARAADGQVRVALDDPEAWSDVDPDSGFVPARVKGRLVTATVRRAPVHLAVSVRGVIRAVTRTHAWDERTARFSAMLPEAALDAGKNAVAVFLISGTPSRPVLQRIEVDSPGDGAAERDGAR